MAKTKKKQQQNKWQPSRQGPVLDERWRQHFNKDSTIDLGEGGGRERDVLQQLVDDVEEGGSLARRVLPARVHQLVEPVGTALRLLHDAAVHDVLEHLFVRQTLRASSPSRSVAHSTWHSSSSSETGKGFLFGLLLARKGWSLPNYSGGAQLTSASRSLRKVGSGTPLCPGSSSTGTVLFRVVACSQGVVGADSLTKLFRSPVEDRSVIWFTEVCSTTGTSSARTLQRQDCTCITASIAFFSFPSQSLSLIYFSTC